MREYTSAGLLVGCNGNGRWEPFGAHALLWSQPLGERPLIVPVCVNAMQRTTVLFSGHVQGVGFRYTTHSIARRFDVTGYVQNLPDRRVELVVEGERQEIDSFLRTVRERFFNHIRDERVDASPATGEFGGFEIRH